MDKDSKDSLSTKLRKTEYSSSEMSVDSSSSEDERPQERLGQDEHDSGFEADELNGDDVPLVEEAMKDMFGLEDDKEPVDVGVDVEKFMDAIVQANAVYSELGHSSVAGNSSASRKRRASLMLESGMG